MIKIKVNIKKFIPYILFFSVFFAISSFVMISVKKGIEKKMGQYYSAKLLEIEEEYRKKDSSAKEVDEQKKTKEAVRVLKGVFS